MRSEELVSIFDQQASGYDERWRRMAPIRDGLNFVLVGPDAFELVSGESELTKYLFGPGKGQHFFCKHCGVRVFGVGPGMYGINIGCVEGVTEEELSRIPITHVDGMNDRWNERPPFWQHL